VLGGPRDGRVQNRAIQPSVSAPESQPAVDAGEFYDEMWERYGHLDSASPAAFHRRRLILELCTRYAAGARQVLDAGCGQGELLQELRLGFPNATLCASDVSLASVRETKRLNPNLEVLQMDLCVPDFERVYRQYLGRFELITCSEVVEHIPDDCLAVERVARLLAPRGTLVLTVPGGKMSRFDELIGHQRHYSPERLRELSQHANLEPVEVLAWGFPFQNLYRSAVRIVSRLSMPKPGEAPKTPSGGRNISGVLGAGYSFFGRALKPLFYLNRNFWGEQMLLVARKR
jgi:SAM-dependent methyltransferase